jgi:hypothetical protein
MYRHNGNNTAMMETQNTPNIENIDIYNYHNYIIIYRNKITVNLLVVFFSNKNYSKSILGFGFWTFINVHFWKPEKSLEKDPLK